MNKRIDVLIQTKDRPMEVALLLQSLRTQTYQDFDIFILDDAGGTPITNYHFVNCLITRMKQENHLVEYKRNNKSFGITRARIQMVKWCKEKSKNNFILRVDDDCILEKDYIQKLMEVIDKGYDLASGLTPAIFGTDWLRETKFVKPFINDITLDKEGNIIKFGDDCGYNYLESEIIPSPHFRSAALYKKSIHDKANYASHLTDCGFREEEFFAFDMITKGYKIGVHTGAKAWHLLTPSGGDRRKNYNELAMTNENMMRDYIKKLYKKYGDFVNDYRKRFKD